MSICLCVFVNIIGFHIFNLNLRKLTLLISCLFCHILDLYLIYFFLLAGAHYQTGAKTVIPAKVIGKFSIRIVPNQEPEEVEKLVFDYINKKVLIIYHAYNNM